MEPVATDCILTGRPSVCWDYRTNGGLGSSDFSASIRFFREDGAKDGGVQRVTGTVWDPGGGRSGVEWEVGEGVSSGRYDGVRDDVKGRWRVGDDVGAGEGEAAGDGEADLVWKGGVDLGEGDEALLATEADEVERVIERADFEVAVERD